jgi:NAD(P)H-flavin reductase/hemoglobin-like flavoprotein
VNTQALRQSWAQVTEAGTYAAQWFYQTLWTIAPEIRQMFPLSMSMQNEKLLAALGHIVSHVDDPQVVGDFTRDLGADHRRFRVEPIHYEFVGKALLLTLEHFLGRSWTAELADDWTAAYQEVKRLMLDGAARDSTKRPAVWSCRVTKATRSGDVLLFTILPDYQCRYRPGQSMPIKAPGTGAWRHLSPANAPRRDGTIDFHVRAVGSVSSQLVHNLRVGDVIEMGAPTGSGLVTHDTGASRVLMVAGGTGVAPFCAILDDPEQWRRPTTLVYGASTPLGLYHHRELTRIAAGRPSLIYVPTVEVGRHWRGATGTALDIAVTRFKLRLLDAADTDVAVCGSPAMTAATVAALSAIGVPSERLHTEQALYSRPLVGALPGAQP